MTLFFAFYGSFRIPDGTLVMTEDRDNTSYQTFVQKLTKIHVNTSKVLIRVLCIKN
jgi:hypothetical protein